MVLCPSVGPSVCHKPVFYRNGWTVRARFRHRGYPRLILHWAEGNSSISKNKAISFWNCILNSGRRKKFRHGTLTVASVVNLVRPTTVASSSHWTSTFVYNTLAVTQGVARVHLQQLRHVSRPNSTCSISYGFAVQQAVQQNTQQIYN